MLNTIKKQLKDAMVSKDKKRISALRNILAMLKLKEIEKKEELTKDECLKVFQKISKQLKDSINQYKIGNRADLVKKEAQELEILTEFLPEAISEEDLKQIIIDIIRDTGASSMKDMGKVMGMVISKSGGRADGSLISKIVKENLSWIL